MASDDTSPDAARLLRTRGLRALVDGTVAVVLPSFLLARGFNPTQVGAVITATLLGSAAVTLTIALRGGRLDRHTDLSEFDASRGVFFVYALVGVALLLQYRGLAPRPPVEVAGLGRSGLGRSKAIVLRLSVLFSIDSFGSGFAVQSILVLWLALRHDLSTATTGAVFFWSGLLTASSALLAPRLAGRIGLIRTMVFTHLPANGLLMAAALVPSAAPAVACLLARAVLSQMDVPARTSYVMAVVDPEERTAAATVTNVPRSLASALPPLAAGWMLQHSSFGWPLLLAGALKIAYDLALLALFRDVRPPEEIEATA